MPFEKGKSYEPWNKGLKRVQISPKKGKTNVELYGIEKSEEISQKIGNANSPERAKKAWKTRRAKYGLSGGNETSGNPHPWNEGKVGVQVSEKKGLTWEEYYGEDRAKESKQKLSSSVSDLWLNPEYLEHQKGSGIGIGKSGYREDLGMKFRSTWEANIARVLNYLCVEWKYEPEVFHLSCGNYIPDFYLPLFDIWLEVKGFWKKNAKNNAKQKYEEFALTHNTLLLDKEMYYLISENMASRIVEWE